MKRVLNSAVEKTESISGERKQEGEED